MITFAALGKLGRLGNQLFQYAALRGLGLRNNYETKIPEFTATNWHGQKCLLSNLNLKSSSLEPKDIKTLKGRYFEPDYMKFDARFYELPNDIDLY